MPQPKEKAEVRHIGLVKAEKPDLARLIRPDGGYFRTYNGLSDALIQELGLNVYEQAVLFRLYRLSFGWERVTCTVGFKSLMEHTNISESHLRRTLASLTQRGLIESYGKPTKAGTTYRVLPGVEVPPKGVQQTPVQRTPVRQELRGVRRNTSNARVGARQTPNTDTEINTDTDTENLLSAEEIRALLAEGEE